LIAFQEKKPVGRSKSVSLSRTIETIPKADSFGRKPIKENVVEKSGETRIKRKNDGKLDEKESVKKKLQSKQQLKKSRTKAS
jgi:hypothetical protein